MQVNENYKKKEEIIAVKTKRFSWKKYKIKLVDFGRQSIGERNLAIRKEQMYIIIKMENSQTGLQNLSM